MTEKEKLAIHKIIRSALEEDLGDGDHTTLATIPVMAMGKAQMIAKSNGIISGTEVAAMVFTEVDPAIKVELLMGDGMIMKPGDILMTVEGPSGSILTAERTALNFIQRMCGIATFTHSVVSQLAGLNTRLLDTRKTTPGNRMVEKMAVRAGGGHNHRIGLYDMIMIKDNHVDFAGGITQAVSKTLQYLEDKGKSLKIEVEVRNFEELDTVLSLKGVDRVMLDNFSPADLKVAVRKVNGQLETEASGGISIDNIRSYAETGVDFISVGALTHQIQSLDISLKAV